MSEAFVYCWTDHFTNKLYIGSHKGNPNDGYICSSKYMNEEYNKRPYDFTRQILAEGMFSDIRKLEEVLLNTMDVKNDDQFYNQHNGNGKFFLKHFTKEHREKLSKAFKGKKTGPKSEETKQKMRKPKSDEHKAKFLGNKNAAGIIKSKETIEKARKSNLGKKRSSISKMNIKLGQINRYKDPNQKEIQKQAAKKGWITRRMNNGR